MLELQPPKWASEAARHRSQGRAAANWPNQNNVQTGSPARNGKKPSRNARFDQRLARQGQGAGTSLRLQGVNKRKKTRLAKEAAKHLAVARYKAGPWPYNVIDGFTLRRIAAGVAKSLDAPAETGTKSQLAAFASARRRNTERLIVSLAKNLDFDNGELVHTAETLLSVAAVAKVSATVRKRQKRVDLDGQLDLIRVLEVEALSRGKKLEMLAATGWDMEFADIAARIKADDAAALDLPACIREAVMLYVHVCV